MYASETRNLDLEKQQSSVTKVAGNFNRGRLKDLSYPYIELFNSLNREGRRYWKEYTGS